LLAPGAALSQGRRPAGRVLFWAGSLAAAAALIAVFLLGQRRPAVAELVLTGPTGSPIEAHNLADGSVVELNRGAELAVAFSPAERHVRLERGEAHFTVAKNPDRPFIVSAAGIDVRAVGTQFDVRFDATELDVVVTEGRVKVGSIPLVSAGERAVVALAPGGPPPRRETLSAGQLDRLLRWRPRELDFNGAVLTEFVAAFNRYNAVQLVIADPALADIKLSARLRSDNVDALVRLLERGFDIRAERVGNEILLRKAP
jgi:transmembrane sensor